MVDFDEARKAFAEKYGCGGKLIQDNDAIFFAVSHAYRDMMLRTVPGHGDLERDDLDQLKRDLAQAFARYFNEPTPKSREEFDMVHRRLCNDTFLIPWNNLLAKHGIDPQNYGKAQKIVNMAFKYLACYDDAADYADWFTFCHMPIDTGTFNIQKILSGIKLDTSWSNLSESEYYSFQRTIEQWLSAQTTQPDTPKLPNSPLKADFIIWHEAGRI